MRWPLLWDDKTVRRALSLMPSPLIRQRDAYTAADTMRIHRAHGTRIWNELVKRGWIVRTGHRIGKSTKRFYWERASGFGLREDER